MPKKQKKNGGPSVVSFESPANTGSADTARLHMLQDHGRRIQAAQQDCSMKMHAAKKAKSFLEELHAQHMGLLYENQLDLPLAVVVQAVATVAWEQEKLSAVGGISPGILKSLAKAGIETIGQMAKYARKKHPATIPGINAKAIEKIDGSLDHYWTKHKIEKQDVTQIAPDPGKKKQ